MKYDVLVCYLSDRVGASGGVLKVTATDCVGSHERVSPMEEGIPKTSGGGKSLETITEFYVPTDSTPNIMLPHQEVKLSFAIDAANASFGFCHDFQSGCAWHG